ncbi:HAD-like domain-containing protein [Plectosphaerella cucumerina]|uniref:HAD-like domain-containing protein n=1 Tax=Plectosphaerella cucumerina TaxID=40658 RepID=A0A8K0TDN8_9PEZI|nr:HAD-like domain-containing protein [Plectosphaerella cucumerina]
MPAIERLTTPAFAFDIDGVLVKGKNPIPGARDAIALLQRLDVPFIFLTNGGGLTEEAHVERLATRLDLKLDSRQFIQSHTPYHDLVKLYKDQAVLVLGGSGNQIRDVAEAYGFNNVLTSSDFYADMPVLHPFPEMTHEHHIKHGRPAPRTVLPSPADSDASSDEDDEQPRRSPRDTPIAAIMVWSSPRDWMLDIQLTLDLLLSTGGVVSSPRSAHNGDTSLLNNGYLQDGQPKLYFCNPDFQWATQAPLPRLAQGGFIEALRGVWSKATGGADLLYQVCGKPTERTYEYGENALTKWNEREDGAVRLKQQHHHVDEGISFPVPARASRVAKEISTVYMIGDNPESDIAGANSYASRVGYTWKSALVGTGVYVPGTTPAHIPGRFSKDVLEAVTEILTEEDFVIPDL